jgi:hypothetical protein
LVEGLKSVENRPPGANQPQFEATYDFGDGRRGEWVLIVASTARPSQGVMVQALQDFKRAYGDVQGQQLYDMFVGRHRANWPLGAIVGVVRFDQLLTAESTQALSNTGYLTDGAIGWYHGAPDVGWHIRAGDAIPFTRPIVNIPGVLSIARIATKGLEVETRIRESLRQMI